MVWPNLVLAKVGLTKVGHSPTNPHRNQGAEDVQSFWYQHFVQGNLIKDQKALLQIKLCNAIEVILRRRHWTLQFPSRTLPVLARGCGSSCRNRRHPRPTRHPLSRASPERGQQHIGCNAQRLLGDRLQKQTRVVALILFSNERETRGDTHARPINDKVTRQKRVETQ